MIKRGQFQRLKHGDSFYVVYENDYSVNKLIFIDVTENWDSPITGTHKLRYSTKCGVYSRQIYSGEKEFFFSESEALGFLAQLLNEKLELINEERAELYKPNDGLESRPPEPKSKWDKSILRKGMFWAFKTLGLTKKGGKYEMENL